MKTKLLVTGINGQLGSEFRKQLANQFEIIGVGRKEADMRNYEQVASVINKYQPDYVVHTAAMTDVDRCEEDPEMAIEVNADGTAHVARAGTEIGATIIYYSTDYVFDGAKQAPYIESDTPNPISVYGRSKLAGEQKVQEQTDDYIIMRAGWVYSVYRNNFVKSILTSAKRHNSPLRVVNDQFGSPTWTHEIVKQTVKIIEVNQRGVFHVAGGGEVSRFELAKLILEKMMPDALVEPCATIDYPRAAQRPARSSLKSEKLGKLGIDIMRPYDEALNEFLNEYGERLLNEISN